MPAHTDPRTLEYVLLETLLMQRLSNALGDEVERLLLLLGDDVAGLVAKHDPSSVAARFRQVRVAKLLAELRARVPETYAAILAVVRNGTGDVAGLAQIGRGAGRRQAGHLRTLLGRERRSLVRDAGVTLARAKAIVDSEPLHGHLLKDWFAAQSRSAVFRAEQEIRIGAARGETIDDMVRRIRGRRVPGPMRRDSAGNVIGYEYKGGVISTSTREARSIVRTAVNHISNRAMEMTCEENASVLAGMRFVATLDARTTDVCKAYDGKVYKTDDPGRPSLPLHVGERSIYVPEVDWKGLGMQPPKGGTRASADGPVSADLTYSGWLRQQTAARQNEILGPGRAKLFREGKVDLNDLVAKDGKRVTLKELEAKYS